MLAPARRATTDPLQTVLFSYQSVSQSVSQSVTGLGPPLKSCETQSRVLLTTLQRACANWTIGANTNTNRTTGIVESGQDDKSAGEES